MRLLYACFDEVPSFKGASTHVLATCRGLRREYDVELVSLGSNRLPVRPRFTHRPQSIDAANYLRRGIAFRARVHAMLTDTPPERAQFRSPWEGLPIVASKIPSVYEINGLPSIELAHGYRLTENVTSTLMRWEAFCVREATAIVCPSEHIARCVRDRYGAHAPIHVIPNGYDLPPSTSAPERADDEPLRAVYLGTLHPWQGLFVALRAVELLPRGSVLLDVLGPEQRDFTTRLERVVERRGLGRIVRLVPAMHRGKLTARLPTYHVGLAPLTTSRRNVEQGCCPIKILDYLAHALPVIASDLPVVRSLLAHERQALLVPPNDARALATALSRVLEDRSLWRRLRDAARPSLATHSDWNEHGARVLDVHRSFERFVGLASSAE